MAMSRPELKMDCKHEYISPLALSLDTCVSVEL